MAADRRGRHGAAIDGRDAPVTPIPRAICTVFAMARPGRPAIEREAVLEAAAQMTGSHAQRARRLAHAVAQLTLREIDGPAADRVLLLLRTLDATPAAVLATDPEIDTAGMIRAERIRRLEATGGRRSLPAEDRELLRTITDQLAKRYARHLVGFQP